MARRRVASGRLAGVRPAPVERLVRHVADRRERHEPPADDPVGDLEAAAHVDRPAGAVRERRARSARAARRWAATQPTGMPGRRSPAASRQLSAKWATTTWLGPTMTAQVDRQLVVGRGSSAAPRRAFPARTAGRGRPTAPSGRRARAGRVQRMEAGRARRRPRRSTTRKGPPDGPVESRDERGRSSWLRGPPRRSPGDIDVGRAAMIPSLQSVAQGETMETVRLTVGQAIVRFLAQQYVERDGREGSVHRRRLGHLRAWQRGRPRPGARGARRRRADALLPAPERAGPGPHRGRLRPAPQPPAGVRLHVVGRAGRHEHGHRGRRRRPSTGSRSCSCRATTSPTGRRIRSSSRSSTRSSATPAPTTRSGRCRGSSTGSPVRSSCIGSLPEAFRVLTDPVETGAVTISLPEDVQSEAFDWPERFFERRVWRVRRPLPEAADIADAARLIAAAKAPAHRRGRRRDLLRGDRRARRVRDAVRHPGRRDPGGQGRPALEPPDERRPGRHERRPGRQPARPRRGCRHRRSGPGWATS